MTQHPVTEHPVTQHPVTQHPVTQHPVTQHPVAQHPVAELIRAAAAGRFPPADGSWRRVHPWRAGTEAVIAMTGHAVLAVGADVDEAALAGLAIDGFGGAAHPAVALALAGPSGWIDSLDVLLVARSLGGSARLVERPDLSTHPRVAFARAVRDDVVPYGHADREDGEVAVLARGVGGLPELSFEVEAAQRGRGRGARLIADALTLRPAGDLVTAAVAPGNAASLRLLLRAGFVPIGSVQLFRPARVEARTD